MAPLTGMGTPQSKGCLEGGTRHLFYWVASEPEIAHFHRFLLFRFLIGLCVLCCSSEKITANQGLATLAFFGVGVNLVLFLTRVLHQDIAEAANNVSKWTGTVYIFSLIGAFMSDSYWGRYLTCAIFQIIFILVLFLTSGSWGR